MASWGVRLTWFDCNKVYVVSEQKCVYQWLIQWMGSILIQFPSAAVQCILSAFMHMNLSVLEINFSLVLLSVIHCSNLESFRVNTEIVIITFNWQLL